MHCATSLRDSSRQREGIIVGIPRRRDMRADSAMLQTTLRVRQRSAALSSRHGVGPMVDGVDIHESPVTLSTELP